jgi:hypothetical protein
MRANPLFDDYRTDADPAWTITTGYFDDGWTLIEGSVECDTLRNGGVPVPDRWAFDLPDSNFFFPGDVFKYFIRAEDNAMGDIGVSTIPGDTAGFSTFQYTNEYAESYIVRGLPTVFDAAGNQPEVLFWNDAVGAGFDNEWRFALNQLGFLLGKDYDMYMTNAPSSGVGNGLGSRATSAQLGGYELLLYDAGPLSGFTIANGDLSIDGSNDVAVLTNWFGQGDKNAVFFGDGVVTDLNGSGTATTAFLNSYFSVLHQADSIVDLINNQTAPLVKAVSGNGILTSIDEWIAFGGCPGINRFDAVTPVGTAQRLAEFTDPQGNAGVYPYSAATYNLNTEDNAEVISFPYSYRFFVNAPGWTPPAGLEGLSGRTVALNDILDLFGAVGLSDPIGVDVPASKFAVSNFPNPFNPSTTIELNLPRAGEVSLKVFNVRGELVRTLVDGQMAAGEHSIVWDGRTDSGNETASGVYFYETRANNEVKINKMALVK